MPAPISSARRLWEPFVLKENLNITSANILDPVHGKITTLYCGLPESPTEWGTCEFY
jgi:hypothetical protein